MKLYQECIGHGSPVLLIHGVLSDHTFFSGVAQHLSNHCKVILYDRSGYGESPTVDGADYSLRTQAKEAYQVLKEFTDEPACIVGHSAGAHIALELAIQHPQIVKSLVLIEPSLGSHPEDVQILARWHNELADFVWHKQHLKILTSFQKITGTKRSKKTASSLYSRPVQMDRMRKNLEAFVRGELWEMDTFAPPEALLRQLSVPITVAVTQHNPDNLFFNTAMHDGTYFEWPVVSFPGSHSSIEEHAELFAKQLIELLQI